MTVLWITDSWLLSLTCVGETCDQYAYIFMCTALWGPGLLPWSVIFRSRTNQHDLVSRKAILAVNMKPSSDRRLTSTQQPARVCSEDRDRCGSLWACTVARQPPQTYLSLLRDAPTSASLSLSGGTEETSVGSWMSLNSPGEHCS